MSALAPALQAFFTDRLVGQRDASPNTIAACKTGLRLLVGFAAQRTGTKPSALDIAELDAPLIAAFLDHLERDRHNSVATRNSRLAAIHSLFGYLALHHPDHAGSIQRVLAISAKRTQRNLITYLTERRPLADAPVTSPVVTRRPCSRDPLTEPAAAWHRSLVRPILLPGSRLSRDDKEDTVKGYVARKGNRWYAVI
ncbi:MAG: site-specific integrase [Thermoleophilaceae bacterium]